MVNFRCLNITHMRSQLFLPSAVGKCGETFDTGIHYFVDPVAWLAVIVEQFFPTEGLA